MYIEAGSVRTHQLAASPVRRISRRRILPVFIEEAVPHAFLERRSVGRRTQITESTFDLSSTAALCHFRRRHHDREPLRPTARLVTSTPWVRATACYRQRQCETRMDG